MINEFNLTTEIEPVISGSQSPFNATRLTADLCNGYGYNGEDATRAEDKKDAFYCFFITVVQDELCLCGRLNYLAHYAVKHNHVM